MTLERRAISAQVNQPAVVRPSSLPSGSPSVKYELYWNNLFFIYLLLFYNLLKILEESN
jgi:hypothetical protein